MKNYQERYFNVLDEEIERYNGVVNSPSIVVGGNRKRCRRIAEIAEIMREFPPNEDGSTGLTLDILMERLEGIEGLGGLSVESIKSSINSLDFGPFVKIGFKTDHSTKQLTLNISNYNLI